MKFKLAAWRSDIYGYHYPYKQDQDICGSGVKCQPGKRSIWSCSAAQAAPTSIITYVFMRCRPPSTLHQPRCPNLTRNASIAFMQIIILVSVFAASALAIPKEYSVGLLTGIEAMYPPENPPKCPSSFPCYGNVDYLSFRFTNIIRLTGKDKTCCPPG
jgi:hypothetical protein